MLRSACAAGSPHKARFASALRSAPRIRRELEQLFGDKVPSQIDLRSLPAIA